MAARRKPNPPRNSPNPPGRPTKIDQPITLPDGTTTTIGQRIIQLLALGAYVERAATSVGVNKGTLYGWMDRAAKTRERIALDPTFQPTDLDLNCITFCNGVEAAEANYELTALAALERIGQGGIQLSTTVEKYNAKGELIERSTKITGLAPNPQVIMWKLVRKFPERYQIRQDAGAGQTPAGEMPIDLTPDKIAEMINDIDQFTTELANGN